MPGNATSGEQSNSRTQNHNQWTDSNLTEEAPFGGAQSNPDRPHPEQSSHPEQDPRYAALLSVPTELHTRGADDLLRIINENEQMPDGSERTLGDIADEWRLIGRLIEDKGGFPDGMHPSGQDSLYALIATNPTVLDYRHNVHTCLSRLQKEGRPTKSFERASSDLEQILYVKQLDLLNASSQRPVRQISEKRPTSEDRPTPKSRPASERRPASENSPTSNSRPASEKRPVPEAPYRYQTRGEHSRSLEDAERYKALETLRELGLLIPLEDQDLYHGRARQRGESESWHVQPGYDNTHGNVGVMPAIYTGDWQSARDYARHGYYGRSSSVGVEIHQMASRDPDATVLDFDGFSYHSARHGDKLQSLTPDQRQRLQAALHAISIDPRKHTIGYLDGRASITTEDQHLAQYTSSRLQQDPADYAYRCLTGAAQADREYFSNWLRANHIVGVKVTHQQNRLGYAVTSYIMIDEVKVDTADQIERERANYTEAFAAISKTLSPDFKPTVHPASDLMDTLATNPNVTPEKLLDLARDIPGFREIYDSSAENWEGFTIGEHTETVLRNFNETYGDTLPVELLPAMNMAILVHDLGKGEAKRNHADQKPYNIRYAQQFMEANGISLRTRSLISGLIGEGQELAKAVYINHEAPVSALVDYFRSLLNENGLVENAKEKARALAELSRILQECDSKAYTTMGVTRRELPNGDIYFRNYGSFNSSFGDPVDITGRQAPLVGRPPRGKRAAA